MRDIGLIVTLGTLYCRPTPYLRSSTLGHSVVDNAGVAGCMLHCRALLRTSRLRTFHCPFSAVNESAD